MDFTKNNFKFSSPEAKVPAFSQASVSVTQSSSNKVSMEAELRNHWLKHVVIELKPIFKVVTTTYSVSKKAWKQKTMNEIGECVLSCLCNCYSFFVTNSLLTNHIYQYNESPFMTVVLIIIGNFWSDHTVELSINLQVRVLNFCFLLTMLMHCPEDRWTMKGSFPDVPLNSQKTITISKDG